MKRIYLFVAASTLAAALFHGLALGRWLPWHVAYSDVLAFSSRALAPGFAYVDKQIEYPVLTGVFIDLAGKLGVNRYGYYAVSALGLMAAALGTTYFLLKLAGEEGKRRLVWLWALAPSMLLFSVYNWDMLAIFAGVVALYCIKKDRDYWAAFFIAIGFSLKFFPVLFLAPLLLRRVEWRRCIAIGGIFGATALLANIGFMYAHFDGWAYFFKLNQMRSSNPDSIWTVIRFLFPSFQSVPAINTVSFVAFAGSAGYFLWCFRRADPLRLCFGLTLLFLLFNKVFSPQYLLWLLPFFAVYGTQEKWFYTLELANIGALYFALRWFLVERTMHYFYWMAPFVVLRHIALIAVLHGLITDMKKTSSARQS